ncbi:MAG: GNAT family N-acetyltransferase [Streptosporangiales bacterium]
MIEPISPTDLLEASDDDPYCRIAALGGEVSRAWAGAGAVVWLRHDEQGRPRLASIGSPRAAASVVPEVAANHPDGLRASLPRGGYAYLPDDLNATHVGDWDWFCTTSAPASQPGEPLVSWLTASDDDEIRALLREVSPGASTWPGDARARRWAGLRTPGGRLAAALADTSQVPRIGHLSSVATALDARGNGYGTALTAWATRQFLAEAADLVTLGMYAENDTARRMYERLGYRCAHQFSGGHVEPSNVVSV